MCASGAVTISAVNVFKYTCITDQNAALDLTLTIRDQLGLTYPAHWWQYDKQKQIKQIKQNSKNKKSIEYVELLNVRIVEILLPVQNIKVFFFKVQCNMNYIFISKL